MRLRPILQTSVRPVALGAGALAVVVALTGCFGAPAPAPSTPAVTHTITPVPDPVLKPDGTASENKAYFDFVNQRTIAADASAGGQAFTTGLRDAGFAIADMQVTVDTTTVGVKADSVQFSVLWKGQCLVGQYGFSSYTSIVVPALGTGKCLVGETRTIDW